MRGHQGNPGIKPLPDGQWQIDFRLSRNKRYRRKFPTRAAAKAFYEEVTATGGEIGHDLPELIRQYLNWSEKIRKKSYHTVRSDRGRLRIFLEWCRSQDIDRVNQITFKVIDSFRGYFYDNAPFDKDRVKKRYKPPNIQSTWEHYRQNLSSFLAWCRKRGLVTDNPARDPEFKPDLEKNIPPHFTPDELRRLFDFFDERDRDQPVPYFSIIFRTLAYTGMRSGELRELKWKNVDLAGGEITIEKSKNRTARIIPIFKKLRPWLEKLPRDSRYVFGDSNGHLYTQSWILRQLEFATTVLGMERRRVHDLRHSFAASLARAGESLGVIQQLMGHKLISSTMIYIHFYRDDLKKAIDSLDI